MAGHQVEDVAELFTLLESNDLNVVRQIQELITENLNQSKDAWLLNGVVDFYMVSRSNQCLDILSTVNEPHDKYLLDRLVDHLRGNNKLASLTALGYLIRRQLPWLHKVVNHPLLSTTLKCLKAETDVPVLLTGLLDVTALLPLVPVTVTTHLQDIFIIFSRMASFNIHKPGNVPDVYLLHLQVGTYSLFHRLYGMYPCHFLTYLRSTYSRRENMLVFNNTIKPMLDTVRVHPLLVTANKDREVATDRWRQMEVQDIIADCAKLALDPIEGNCEEPHCPITAFHTKQKHYDTNKSLSVIGGVESGRLSQLAGSSKSPHGSFLSPLLAPPTSQEEAGILGTLDSTVIWSPATKCGLSTPPPHTQAAAMETMSMSRLTPSSTPVFPHLESPLQTSTNEEDKPGPRVNTTTPTSDLSKRRKRLSGFTLSLAGKITTPTETNLVPFETSSVPPSPLKPNFTTEPPFNAQRMQAIRKINFQQPTTSGDFDARNESTSVAMDKGSDALIIKGEAATDSTVVMKSDETHPLEESSGLGLSTEVYVPTTTATPSATPSTPTSARKLVSGECNDKKDEKIKAKITDVPSVTQLSSVISNLGVNTAESHMMEDVDNEVLEITGHDDGTSCSSGSLEMPSHLPNDTSLTAASVAAFMKKVNRIRFNTVGAVHKDAHSDKLTSRPRSCPDLGETEVQGHFSRSSTSMSRERSGTDVSQCSRSSSKSDRGRRVEFTVAVTASVSESFSMSSCSVACQTSFSTLGKGRMAVMVYDHETAKEDDEYLPYDHLFPLTLPFAPLIQCFNCAMKDSASVNKHREGLLEPSIYTSFSPADLLDRHLERGGDVHAKQLNHLPLPYKETISWTHFGGMPPADEVAILRGQNQLLHNQVMFERNRRELHAKRNRRLLGRIVKTVALEEQTLAMKEQSGLQETEISRLSAQLKQLKTTVQQLKADKDSYECERQVLHMRHQEEMNDLQTHNLDLESELQESRKKNSELSTELQSCYSKVFDLSQEQRALKHQLESFATVKAKLERCEQELVLMGEVQEKYRQRLVEIRHSHQSRPASDLMLEACRADAASLTQKLHQSQINLDISRAKLRDLDQQVKVKDTQLSEQQSQIEQMRAAHQSQLQAVEEKYVCQKSITSALESHILSLYSQIGLLESAQASDNKIPKQSAASSQPATPCVSPSVPSPVLSAPLSLQNTSSQRSLSESQRSSLAPTEEAVAMDSDTEVALEAGTALE